VGVFAGAGEKDLCQVDKGTVYRHLEGVFGMNPLGEAFEWYNVAKENF
jgi:hypothetical protein